jgi:hypothetical protein
MPGRARWCSWLAIHDRFVSGRQQSGASWLVGDVAAPPVAWLCFHHERNEAFLDHQVDLESASATPYPNQRNVGDTMLLPFIIFLMILSPVLIPAAVTLVNVMQGNHRPAGQPGFFAARRLLPAAA